MSRPYRCVRLLAASSALAWLCSCGFAPDQADGLADGVVPGFDSSYPDSCHTDCFGGRSCVNGHVLEMKSEAIPCNLGKSCQFKLIYTCKTGCNPYLPAKNYAEPMAYCAEFPKTPGDPCNSDRECQPVNPPGSLLPGDVTMTCDLVSHACVSPDQPTLADFQGSCGLPETTFADSAWATNSGFATVDKCAGKTCLVAFSRPNVGSTYPPACLAQLCSKPCKTSWNCPQGARCAYVSSLALEVGKGGVGPGDMVCVPAKGQQSFQSNYSFNCMSLKQGE